MRVFTRCPKQSVTIGGAITITVLEIRGRQVRIGISAPSHVDIQREEIAGSPRAAGRRSVANP
jgi:carbon storage regulator